MAACHSPHCTASQSHRLARARHAKKKTSTSRQDQEAIFILINSRLWKKCWFCLLISEPNFGSLDSKICFHQYNAKWKVGSNIRISCVTSASIKHGAERCKYKPNYVKNVWWAWVRDFCSDYSLIVIHFNNFSNVCAFFPLPTYFSANKYYIKNSRHRNICEILVWTFLLQAVRRLRPTAKPTSIHSAEPTKIDRLVFYFPSLEIENMLLFHLIFSFICFICPFEGILYGV